MKKTTRIALFLLLFFSLVLPVFADEIYEPAPTPKPGIAERFTEQFNNFQFKSSRQAPLGIWIAMTVGPCLMFAILLIPFRKNADANTPEAGNALWQWTENRENRSLRISYESHVPGGFFYTDLVGSKGASVQNVSAVYLSKTAHSAAAVEELTKTWKKKTSGVSSSRDIPGVLEKEIGAVENGTILRLTGGCLYWAAKGDTVLTLIRRGEEYPIAQREGLSAVSVLAFPLEADDQIRLTQIGCTTDDSALIRITEKE